MNRFLHTTLSVAISAVLFALSGARAQAQFRYHLQSHVYSGMHSAGPDSIFLPIAIGNECRMAVFDTDSAHWTILGDTSFPANPQFLAMADNRHGIAAAYSGKLLITQNGWKTAEIVAGVSGARFVYHHDNEYIAGLDGLGGTSLYWSPDGRNWTLSDPQMRTANYFSVSGRYVWAGSITDPWFSTDGGHTFGTLTRSLPNAGQIKSYQLIGADTLLVVGSNGLFRTTDQGRTYTHPTLPAQPDRDEIQWLNASIGAYTVQTPSRGLYFTIDGGQTWSHPATLPFDGVNRLFRHGQYWYVTDGEQEIWRTADMGATFTRIIPGYASFNNGILDVDFQGKFGVAVGGLGHVAVSLDGGRYFDIRTSPNNQDLFAVGIAPNGDIYAGDRKGQVFASTDRGATWTNKLSQTILNLIATKFCFSQNGSLIVMQRSGQPAVSTDTGHTFNFVSGFGGNHVFSVKPASATMIGAALESNGLGPNLEVYSVNTSTGQRTRLCLITAAGQDVTGLHMVNENVGYLVTATAPASEMRIYRTNDGWQTATPCTAIPIAQGLFTLGGVTFQDFGPQTLFLHEKTRQYYLKTTDGGQSWQRTNLTVAIPGQGALELNRPYFFAEDKYIFPMNNRMFLLNSFQNGTTPSPAAILPRLGTAISTLNAYPNPAANEIRFSLTEHKPGMRAMVLDMTGKQILTVDASTERISLSNVKPGLYQLVIAQQSKAVKRVAFVKE